MLNDKDSEKLAALIEEIKEKHCYMCGTQAPTCGCIYDTVLKKLDEITELNEDG